MKLIPNTGHMDIELKPGEMTHIEARSVQVDHHYLVQCHPVFASQPDGEGLMHVDIIDLQSVGVDAPRQYKATPGTLLDIELPRQGGQA